ncbi:MULTISPECIES: hypothetical protein [Cyanophyceae]|uniref:hypothetical protein n=1 Tax=Cyanophyceae TaxID=3028117 RepID=UPI00016DCCEC|nr:MULTISPECIES: hypothetical protein [Cyanophyceae]ACB01032.1 hypothetical protein SYNPCC7002_F0101 [Picosynechococcus sp. PCC 7002]SMH58686.1 hypothetical protein SAMN06272755_3245 [Picosynechococcus sp. OG1]SMQ86379.1 hypothetical protein SAMN06272774_3119 [Synechococcus sp. 7002]
MTFQDIQTQVRQLPDADKWQLVRILLDELQPHETTPSMADISATPSEAADALSPWIQQLIGIAQLEPVTDPTELYIDYLEEKYS